MGSLGFGPGVGYEDDAGDGEEEFRGKLRATAVAPFVPGHSLHILGQQDVFCSREINRTPDGASRAEELGKSHLIPENATNTKDCEGS
jgi:hypothetical protein